MRAWQCLTLAGRLSPGDRVPDRQELLVERQGLLVVAGLHRVPELHAEDGHRGEDRGDRPVGAQGEGRVEERVHRAHDPGPIAHQQQQVGEKLHVPRALLDPDHPGHRLDDPGQELRREIGPRHHVVDDDRQAGPARQGVEVPDHRVVVRPEQVVHRRHLQGGDAQIADREPALHRGRGAVGDDAGDDRDPAAGLVDHRGGDAAHLVGGEGVPLAGAAGDREPVHPCGLDQVAGLGPERVLVDGVVRAERSGHRRNDAVDMRVLGYHRPPGSGSGRAGRDPKPGAAGCQGAEKPR